MNEPLSIAPFDGFKIETDGGRFFLMRSGEAAILDSIIFREEKAAVFASHVIASWFDLDEGTGLIKCPSYVSPKVRNFANGKDCAR